MEPEVSLPVLIPPVAFSFSSMSAFSGAFFGVIDTFSLPG